MDVYLVVNVVGVIFIVCLEDMEILFDGFVLIVFIFGWFS